MQSESDACHRQVHLHSEEHAASMHDLRPRSGTIYTDNPKKGFSPKSAGKKLRGTADPCVRNLASERSATCKGKSCKMWKTHE